jgi:hypothetical protein
VELEQVRPEWIALAVNTAATLYYIVHRAEPGKILYWIGATVITIGLLKMKG